MPASSTSRCVTARRVRARRPRPPTRPRPRPAARPPPRSSAGSVEVAGTRCWSRRAPGRAESPGVSASGPGRGARARAVVVGQALDVVVERVEARPRPACRPAACRRRALAHSAAPRRIDVARRRRGSSRPARRAPSRSTSSPCRRASAQRGDRDAGRDAGVPQARAVEVHAQAVARAPPAQSPRGRVERHDRAARAVVRVLEAQQRASARCGRSAGRATRRDRPARARARRAPRQRRGAARRRAPPPRPAS